MWLPERQAVNQRSPRLLLMLLLQPLVRVYNVPNMTIFISIAAHFYLLGLARQHSGLRPSNHFKIHRRTCITSCERARVCV